MDQVESMLQAVRSKAQASYMELIVGLAECKAKTTLIQCPSKRHVKHEEPFLSFSFIFFSFGTEPLRKSSGAIEAHCHTTGFPESARGCGTKEDGAWVLRLDSYP